MKELTEAQKQARRTFFSGAKVALARKQARRRKQAAQRREDRLDPVYGEGARELARAKYAADPEAAEVQRQRVRDWRAAQKLKGAA